MVHCERSAHEPPADLETATGPVPPTPAPAAGAVADEAPANAVQGAQDVTTPPDVPSAGTLPASVAFDEGAIDPRLRGLTGDEPPPNTQFTLY